MNSQSPLNPYEALGVPKESSDADVKKAYRNLARQHHPDKGGDPEQFKKIQEAYEILSDPQKRQNFDQFGSAEGPQFPGGGGGFPPDLFAQMFGGAFGGPRGPVHRANREHGLTISFEDSFRGVTKNLKIGLAKPCFACFKKCPQCHGRGMVHVQLGPMALQQPCPMCGGQAGVRAGCEACGFAKQKIEHLNLQLNIPAGIADGHQMLARGLGEQAQKPDEEPGDLVFIIKVAEHPEFMRQGDDLIWSTRISFEDSVHGKKITIPHFDGPIHMDTADWGVIDPREDYIIPGKGFNKGRLRVSFNVLYPPARVRWTLTKTEPSS